MTGFCLFSRRQVAAIGVLLLLGACQAQTGAVQGATDEEALLARILAGAGEARCSQDAQCRSLPLGEKPCGGPERWLAWSSLSPQADQLARWATDLAALARQRNQRSGLVGNCQFQPDPGVRCQAQRCVLQAPASFPPSPAQR